MTQENDETPAEEAGNNSRWPAHWPPEHIAQVEAQQARKSQIGLYYGLGPEPARDSGKWEDWIDTLYVWCDWSKVPLDWKPGDPTADDLEREAIRLADEALARIIESGRGGRST
jgi:hypothetical protein